HHNFGAILWIVKRDEDGAISCFRKAIALDPRYANAHISLGNVLQAKGKVDEAIACYREAIRLEPDYADVHCHLGRALLQKGQFHLAVQALGRGHQLGSRNPSWPYPSAQWLRQAEQMARLDDRLIAVLAGKDMPKDAAERIGFAQLC